MHDNPQLVALRDAAQEILDRSEAEHRDLTDAEAAECRALLARFKSIAARDGVRKMLEAESGDAGPVIVRGMNDRLPIGEGNGLGAKAIAGGLSPANPVVLPGAEGYRATRFKASWPTEPDFPAPPGVVPFSGDSRFVYPSFPARQADPSQLSISDFALTASSTSGDVLRYPGSTGEKAVIDTTVALAAESMRQVACLIQNVPNAVLAASRQLQDLLDTRMRFELDRAVDDHLIDQIDAASVPNNAGTGDLLSKVRQAITVAKANGANPTVLALDPADAEALDLAVQPGAYGGEYIFPSRSAGVASPVFNLTIVESPAMASHDPLVIDPAILGVLYLGGVVIAADPYTGFSKNTTNVRAEALLLFHVRDANGAVRIGS